MARRKHLSVASANHRRKNSNKKISLSHKQQQDLEDKFSRMSITRPSKIKRLRGLASIKPPTQTPKRKTFLKPEQRRPEPLVPPLLYDLLQEVIVCIELAETHKDDFYYQLQLEGCEATIHKVAAMDPDSLPRDWKYDRATVGNWGCMEDYYV